MDTPFDVQQLQVASPCYERWADMKGDEQVRHCASCKLNVYNVKQLTTAEVEALMQRTQGQVCMRLYRRWDGTVLTRDCPVGEQRVRVRIAASLVTAAAFSLVLLMPFLVRLGIRNRDELAQGTLAERLDDMRYEAYGWPVVGAVLEKVAPRPRYTMGVIRGGP